MIYAISVTVAGVDVTEWIKSATIDYGRSTPDEGFTTPQAVLDFFTPGEAPAPLDTDAYPDLAFRDTVTIDVTRAGGTAKRRFTGILVAQDWSLYNRRVIASGSTIDWSLRQVGDTQPTNGMPNGIPLDPALDLDRAATLATQAGLDLNVVGTEGRWVVGIPADTPGRPFLDVLLEMAEDCDALVRENRDATVDYVARVHTVPTRYTIPPGIVDAESIDLNQEGGQLVNAVDVYYGPVSEVTGQQPHVYDDDSSGANTIASGERREALNSTLLFAAGASGRANQYLGDHAVQWRVPDVTLVMALATGTQADAVMALEEGDPVTFGSLPAGCPITSLDANVIGVTDILHKTDYRIILHIAAQADAVTEPTGNATTDGLITGGDTTGTYTDGDGQPWRWHRFPIDDVLTVDPDAAPVVGRVLIVAGGGGGGAGGQAGDGGAGGVAEINYLLEPGKEYPVVTGQGGLGGVAGTSHATSGGDSSFNGLTVRGGGGGGNAVLTVNTGGGGQWVGTIAVQTSPAPVLTFNAPNGTVSFSTPGFAGNQACQNWAIVKPTNDTHDYSAVDIWNAIAGKSLTDAGTAIDALGWKIYGTGGVNATTNGSWAAQKVTISGTDYYPAATAVGGRGTYLDINWSTNNLIVVYDNATAPDSADARGWAGGSGGGHGANATEPKYGNAIGGIGVLSHGTAGSAARGTEDATYGGGATSSGSGTSTGWTSDIDGTSRVYASAGVGSAVTWPYGNGGLRSTGSTGQDGADGLVYVAYPTEAP